MSIPSGESYIKVMDWLVDKAAVTLKQTGKQTVVVQDNGPLHLSGLVQKQWERWVQKRLTHILLTQIPLRDESD
jgi:hypothetical protein